MTNNNDESQAILKQYINAIPKIDSTQAIEIVKKFAQTRTDALWAIADSDHAIELVLSAVKMYTENGGTLSEIVCDCDESGFSDDPIKAISMKSARSNLQAKIKSLNITANRDSRYNLLRKLKLKIGFVLKILDADKQKVLSRQLLYDRNRMVEANLKLVIKAVQKYINKGIPFMDLIQEGNLGLIIAVEKYDETRGWKFTTMAMQWIRLYASRLVSNSSKTVKLPIHITNAINRINKNIKTHLTIEGKAPTPQQLSDDTGLTVNKISKIIDHINSNPYMIYDSNSVDPLDDQSSINSVPDPLDLEEYMGMKLDSELIRSKLEKALVNLTPRQEKVIRLRYGLNPKSNKTHLVNDEDVTCEEIGKEMGGVSRQWIHKLYQEACETLKEVRYLKKYWN